LEASKASSLFFPTKKNAKPTITTIAIMTWAFFIYLS